MPLLLAGLPFSAVKIEYLAGYLAVISPARDGLHTGDAVWKSVKNFPNRANRASVGVCTRCGKVLFWSLMFTSPKPQSSKRMKITFGLFGVVALVTVPTTAIVSASLNISLAIMIDFQDSFVEHCNE
eukprot:m.185109 g.185109  ORF g.185109 m.185109 type:complete len:127 (-) comp32220_c0_seq1:67-447(-)